MSNGPKGYSHRNEFKNNIHLAYPACGILVLSFRKCLLFVKLAVCFFVLRKGAVSVVVNDKERGICSAREAREAREARKPLEPSSQGLRRGQECDKIMGIMTICIILVIRGPRWHFLTARKNLRS